MNLLPGIPGFRRSQPALHELSEQWNPLTTLSGLLGFEPWTGNRLLRVEDAVEDGHYVVRAEIPGIDPEKDVEVTVYGGHLTIKAERSEKRGDGGYSEFSYGSFVRTVALPADAQEDDVEASYNKGILTVRVRLSSAEHGAARKIQVKKE